MIFLTGIASVIKYLKKEYNLYLMLLPAIIMFVIFSYIPIYGVTLAFKDYYITKGILGSPWVGLKHFRFLAGDPYILRAFKNTLTLGIYSLLWEFPAPIVFAVMLNEIGNKAFKRIAQTTSYFPHFISTVIVVGLLKEFFSLDGVINNALTGIAGIDPINFFSRPEWFRTLYIGSDIWQGIGWGSIIYLAAITGIDPQLYEAAIVDGASRLKQIRYITIPSIYPTIRILLIFSVAGILGTGFEKVYLMYNPGIYQTADVISTYVYRFGIEGGGFGYATAVGLLNSVIAFILLFMANYISKKLTDTGIW